MGKPTDSSGDLIGRIEALSPLRLAVRADRPTYVRRFAAAHLAAMHDLQPGILHTVSKADFYSEVADPVRREANRRALISLMPAARMRTVFNSGMVSSVDDLAREFDVSSAAAGERLKMLGLIP